ncbi:radical SAM family heme chaperone HemW [Cereibacter sphaeroides]|nr:radical SAM family heme chaperone HemW [Cereibacter sphaeroides]
MKHSGVEDWQDAGFALYVHWPFCAAKCPYCDFNSHVARQIDHDRWHAAYVSEIRRWAERTPGRVLRSIFFGGGTPSLMDPETVGAVIETACDVWAPANDIEITLEANPTSVEIGKFRAFSDAGVNRVSLGVQALDNDALRLLGRMHDVDEAMRAWDVANEVFARTSLDLIYARQFQTAEQWRDELSRALTLGVSHLSLYQLTIEDGTAFGDRYKIGKLPGLPSEDRGADLWDITQELCIKAGLPAYEVSNHAKPGAESRHNLVYWNYGDYVGIGPGAHGRVNENGQRLATVAASSPHAWLASIEAEKPAVEETALHPSDQAGELLMMGIRLSDGVDLSRYERLNEAPLRVEAVRQLTDLGFLRIANGKVAATDAGRPILNSLLRELL